jgi:hypothetical protein
MTKVISAGTVLLVSPNPSLRRKILLERAGTPLVCVDSLPDSYRYIKYFNDVDLVYLDSALVTPDTLRSVETELYFLRPQIKVVYLFTSTKELPRLALPKNALFRLLEAIS